MEKIIKLSGRIDTNNIDSLEKNIMEDIKDYEGDIVMDASELEYISSAGLRMILRVKKQNDSTKIINCIPEVYNIFEMTGFSDMMEISKAFRKISVDNCELIGEGFYGTVYRIDPETIVKVFKRPDCLEMVQREKELSRKAFVLGIPTAIPYDIVQIGDKYGFVFELLNCKTLQKLIQEGEDIEELAKECVKILKKMHSTEVDTNDLSNIKDTIVQNAKDCKDLLSEDTLEKLLTFLNNIEDPHTMLHGDFQIKNLMKQDDEVLIIDMDTLSYGNPLFEFGALYASYVAFACVNKNNPMEFLGIPYEQTKKLWDCIFNTYYEDAKEEEKEELLSKIKMLSYLKVLYIRSQFGDDKNPFLEEEIEFSKNYITDHISELV